MVARTVPVSGSVILAGTLPVLILIIGEVPMVVSMEFSSPFLTVGKHLPSRNRTIACC